jgi:hypothetical protein
LPGDSPAPDRGQHRAARLDFQLVEFGWLTVLALLLLGLTLWLVRRQPA